MLVVDNQKVVYVDCDKTLIMPDLSAYPKEEHVCVEHPVRGPSYYVRNQKNINYVTLLYKQGFDVILWSKNGGDWAKAVATALSLGSCFEIKACLTKSTVYVDDKDCTEWMGDRRWRDVNE